MIAYNWDKTYKGIGLVYEPRIVRVLNDPVLCGMLKKGGRKAARVISAYARAEYQKLYGEELLISEKSLACEIYWHYYVSAKAAGFERRFGKKRFTSWLIFHMDVIDCGEKREDSNRFVWDLLALIF